MPPQQQELRRNYIGLVSDDSIEEHPTVEPVAKPGHLVKDLLVALMAAVLKPRRETRS